MTLIALATITAGTLYQKRHANHVDLRSGAVVQYAVCAAIYAPLALFLEANEVGGRHGHAVLRRERSLPHANQAEPAGSVGPAAHVDVGQSHGSVAGATARPSRVAAAARRRSQVTKTVRVTPR